MPPCRYQSAVWMFVNAVPAYESFLAPAPRRPLSGTVRFGLLSTYPPSTCNVAAFSAALSGALTAQGSEVGVIRIADGTDYSDARVLGELVSGSPSSVAACVAALNEADVAVIQYDDGLYGGAHGDELLSVMDGLRVPSLAIVHSVLKDPAPHQRWVLERVAAIAGRVVVMSEAARERLCGEYGIDRRKLITIPHGAALPTSPRVKRAARPLVLSCGPLGPGKGVEHVIDAMPALQTVPGRPRYLVAGRTHPKVLAHEGEAYREARIEQAQSRGVADSVSFDDRHYDKAALMTLLQSAAVIVLPYDSTDEVTSGVLVDAVASGRPVVATAFPHAVELLRDGAGICVPQGDPEALAAALRKVLTQPRLAGSMAAEARKLAPAMAWPVVATAYVQAALRLITDR